MFLRISKLRASTFCCAFSRALFTQGWVIASPFSRPSRCRIASIRSRTEDAHQIVLQAQEELRRAGVALAARTAAQLVVDAPAFVALRADDVEPARGQRAFLVGGDFGADLRHAACELGFVDDAAEFVADAHVGVAAQLDVGAAAGHVGGDGDGAGNARLRHDRGFLLVIARVQHVVLDLLLLEEVGELFGFFDRGRAHQHRLAALVAILDQLDDGVVLFVDGAIDLVVVVGARDRQIGRNVEDVEVVDVHEFGRFGHGRAGHAGELVVEPEIVLEGDRGERDVLGLDRDVFLRFQRLVQAFGIAPAFHHAAGEFVDDDDAAVLDDVVAVLEEQLVRLQRLVDVMEDR